MYEDYPFWFTFFTDLGFSVKLSPVSSKKVYEEGMESIPSESVCYPAKLAHGHIMNLINDGVKRIFYPGIPYERKDIMAADNNYNCPIVASYTENIKNNVEELKTENIEFINPFLSLADRDVVKKRMSEELAKYGVTKNEVSAAVDKGWEEWTAFRNDMHKKGEETLKYIEDHSMTGIVLAGRPYHTDPEVNHGIPELITSFNMAVLTEDSVAHLGPC